MSFPMPLMNSDLEFFIDPEDVFRCASQDWRVQPASTRNAKWYVYTTFGGVKTYLHRWLMGARKGELVDHCDGNALNNCRSNLRIATGTENNANRLVTISSAGYRGVSRQRNRFRAAIYLDRRHIHLGMYSTAEEAAQAYDRAARELFGEFARPNFGGQK